jgi:hypothetical protein
MLQTIETWDPTLILQPFQRPEDARQDAIAFGPNLTITKGQFVAIKTSDQKAYGWTATNSAYDVTFDVASTGGNVRLQFTDPVTGDVKTTANAAWNATDATYLVAIQAQLDAVLGAGVVTVSAKPTVDTDLTLRFTGTAGNFIGRKFQEPTVITFPTSSTKATTTDVTTYTGLETPFGVSMYSFVTDANGLIYFTGTTTPSIRGAGWQTAPVWIRGTFHPSDLVTAALVAEVDTFTPVNPTTGDIYKLTYTDSALQQTVISVTIGATQTAAAASALLIAAWNANPVTAGVATATGVATVILTATETGKAFSVASSVTGTGTFTRAATTAASGRGLTQVLAAWPGSRLLHNGALLLP